jgi:hypothetical protein
VTSFHKLWHDDQWIEKNVIKAEEFDYGDTEELMLFTGTHPLVMAERISKQDWTYSADISRKSVSFKFRLKNFIERITGWRPGEYKNYKLLKE